MQFSCHIRELLLRLAVLTPSSTQSSKRRCLVASRRMSVLPRGVGGPLGGVGGGGGACGWRRVRVAAAARVEGG